MGKYSEVFVGIDTAKKKHAVAIADAGRDGETRYLGEIDSAPVTIEGVIKKLASKYEKGRQALSGKGEAAPPPRLRYVSPPSPMGQITQLVLVSRGNS